MRHCLNVFLLRVVVLLLLVTTSRYHDLYTAFLADHCLVILLYDEVIGHSGKRLVKVCPISCDRPLGLADVMSSPVF
jgi:hypothetical protein